MRKNNMLDALFPRTRQNILATLLLSPERRWYLSDLAQRFGVPPSSLQRGRASFAVSYPSDYTMSFVQLRFTLIHPIR